MNKSGALGIELEDASLERLDEAATTLEDKLAELTDPADMSRVGTAIATLHAAMHRIRHEARKQVDGADLDEESAATQMLEWLKSHGRLPGHEQ